MILQPLKSNGPLINVTYLIIAVLLWLQALLNPFSYQFFESENEGLLFAPLYRLLSNFPLVQVVLSLVLVFFISFLIQQISTSFTLLKVRTKLPAIIFIMLTGGFPALHTLHPAYIAAVFLMLGIYSLFSVFNNPEPVTHFFNAGLFLSLGALFYINLIVLLPAFFIAVSVLRREPRFRDHFALFIGFIVPVLFALSYLFFTDRLTDAFTMLKNNLLTPVSYFANNYLLIGYIGIVALLTLIGSVKMIQLYDSSKVSTRKYFHVLFIIFLFSLIGFILIPAVSQEILILSFIPLSLMISNLFVSISSRFWSEFLFSLLLVSSVFMQLARYFLPNF
jgi:hypothetical protein